MGKSKKTLHGKKIAHVHNLQSKHVTKKHHKHQIIVGIIGVLICLGGSTLATTHFPCLESLPVFLVDGIAYFIHGVGAIPLLKTFENIWGVLSSVD